MTDKTLGQIAQAAYVEAYKAFFPSDAMNLLTSSENGKCWDAAAAAIVEECAKVMCHRCGDDETPVFYETSRTWCHPNPKGPLVACAADDIRSLKSTEPSLTHKETT